MIYIYFLLGSPSGSTPNSKVLYVCISEVAADNTKSLYFIVGVEFFELGIFQKVSFEFHIKDIKFLTF